MLSRAVFNKRLRASLVQALRDAGHTGWVMCQAEKVTVADLNGSRVRMKVSRQGLGDVIRFSIAHSCFSDFVSMSWDEDALHQQALIHALALLAASGGER